MNVLIWKIPVVKVSTKNSGHRGVVNGRRLYLAVRAAKPNGPPRVRVTWGDQGYVCTNVHSGLPLCP